jgi:hypothetical protein
MTCVSVREKTDRRSPNLFNDIFQVSLSAEIEQFSQAIKIGQWPNAA